MIDFITLDKGNRVKRLSHERGEKKYFTHAVIMPWFFWY